MNFSAAYSIFSKPWLIEPRAAEELLGFWETIRSGKANWEGYKAFQNMQQEGGGKFEISQKFFAKQRVTVAPDSTWDMRAFKGFDGSQIAIIPITGPLMKSDFCGSLGTQSMSLLSQMANDTQSVKTVIYLVDSPGGTVDGTANFANQVKGSNKKTVTLVDDMCASAGYWIGSSANEIYVGNATDCVGSIGVMCTLVDTSVADAQDGITQRYYFATASKDKNKNYLDALKGDGKGLITEELDPLADIFMQHVQNNRAGKIDAGKENVLTGKTYTGQKAVDVGLADGMMSLNDIIERELSGAKSSANSVKKSKVTSVI